MPTPSFHLTCKELHFVRGTDTGDLSILLPYGNMWLLTYLVLSAPVFRKYSVLPNRRLSLSAVYYHSGPLSTFSDTLQCFSLHKTSALPYPDHSIFSRLRHALHTYLGTLFFHLMTPILLPLEDHWKIRTGCLYHASDRSICYITLGIYRDRSPDPLPPLHLLDNIDCPLHVLLEA